MRMLINNKHIIICYLFEFEAAQGWQLSFLWVLSVQQKFLYTELSRHTARPFLIAGKHAGTKAQLQTIKGKGHAMISSKEEISQLMTFWATHLKSAPPPTSDGESYVEVDPGSAPVVLKGNP